MSYISIHAPRAGSDLSDGIPEEVIRISIHAPRAGSDTAVDMAVVAKVCVFQSTLPVRGATNVGGIYG